jgi:hypothetical protein
LNDFHEFLGWQRGACRAVGKQVACRAAVIVAVRPPAGVGRAQAECGPDGLTTTGPAAEAMRERTLTMEFDGDGLRGSRAAASLGGWP